MADYRVGVKSQKVSPRRRGDFMSMIKIENLTFAYPMSYENIFENVNIQIDTEWKLGFIGRNGRGKTTLLRILLGELEYSGRVSAAVKFDYFPYPVKDESRLTREVLNDICPAAEEWEIVRELSCLEIDSDVLWEPFDILSKGQRIKVQLAALFLNEGRFLLIDEPTNHLDTKGRELVAAYLKRKRGFILVSHDRGFLDGCVDHILSLNRSDIEVQAGNFSSFMRNFEQRLEYENTQNERLKKDIDRLKKASAQTAVWSAKTEKTKNGKNDSGLKPDKGYVGHKAAKMMKRSKAIAARRQDAVNQKSELLKNSESAEELKLTPLSYRSEQLADLSDIQIRYGEKIVCAPTSFSVRRGERIALEGKNGSGKSSILKMLVGENIEHTGVLLKGSGLVISYVPQDTSFLKGDLSEFAELHGISESLFKAILRKMDFGRSQFDKDMADFSSGQKKKVLIAKSLCEQAHLYIWDEPLNFIDVYSRIQIERLIQAFSPTMIFVEHDRVFQEKIATKTVIL